MTVPLIALIDLDAFFAQIEQYETPEYRGQPVIIGGKPGGRGVVSTASYEARIFGVHSAMPINMAHRLCPDGIYLRSDMAKYTEYSKRICEVLYNITPVVDQASVDEFYLDLSGMERLAGTPRELGLRCKELIKEQIGLTCSIGIGPNRLIAKLASEYRKPDGLTIVNSGQVQQFLDPLPLKALRGVGKKTLARIAKLNVTTVGQLRQRYTLIELQQAVGEQTGGSLYHQARGNYQARRVSHKSRKSISKETTFSADVSDQQQLKKTMQRLAFNVARSLRKKEFRGDVITIRVRLADFTTSTRQRKLSEPIDSDVDIARIGWELFELNGYKDKSLRLIGIGVVIADEKNTNDESEKTQMDLFSVPGMESKGAENEGDEVVTAIDEILNKFGEDSIRRGG